MKLEIMAIAAVTVIVVIVIVVNTTKPVEYVEEKMEVATTTEAVKDDIAKVMNHYERALRAKKEAERQLREASSTHDHALEVYEQALFNLSVISQ